MVIAMDTEPQCSIKNRDAKESHLLIILSAPH